MKPTLRSLIVFLLAAATGMARNPQPLHYHDTSPEPASPARRVVLVHGFLDTGSIFDLLKQRLHRENVACLVPKLSPSDGRDGLEMLAAQLKRDIDETYGPDQRISIIAFSMGGLVSREYLQELGGASRCDKLITISTPHHGTKAAWIYPGKGAAEMRPGSAFLARLKTSQSALGDMPVVSYRTPMDLIILPPTSSVWRRAVNLQYHVPLHPLMVTTRAVMDDVVRRIMK